MSLNQEDLEPGVINTAMITKALDEERLAGEVGRLAVEDGILLREVTSLRLEFLNILMIDHLWMMTSLVKLHLGNNIIEKIEGLHSLVNLKELDLSFNNIEIIENLEALVKLEVLTVFANRISKLQNMETLVNLMIFSIGNNKIEDHNDVLYLRQFPNLHSLNMASNPCVYNSNKDFRQYVCAVLPQLTYYEYHRITTEERAVADRSYKAVTEKLVKSEEEQRHSKQRAEALTKELTHHAEAFVENLDGDHLFSTMFECDTHGKALLAIGNIATDIYNKFYEETMNVTQQLFKEGLEQHQNRREEIRQYVKCVTAAKEHNTVASQQYTEQFLQIKAEVFLEIHNMLKVVEKLADTEEIADQGDHIARMKVLSDRFNEECQRTWYSLMSQEFTLYEQLEIMVNKESLNNAIQQSHNSHLQAIDSREDQLLTRIEKWIKNYCDEIMIGEIQQCRKNVIEVSHFLDIQKEEFQDLQNLLLNAVASLAPSERASCRREKISDYHMALPVPPHEDGADVASADCVPPETLVTGIKSTEASAITNEITETAESTSNV